MPDTTILVGGRGSARELARLGMKCDKKEVPELTSGAKPVGWWLAGQSRYSGQAASGGETETPGAERDVSLQGMAAMAVGEGKLIGILGPSDEAEPALWWAWPLSSVQITTSGSQGLLKKRPTEITLKTSDGALQLSVVSRLYRNSGSHQTGQEGSLLKALGQ